MNLHNEDFFDDIDTVNDVEFIEDGTKNEEYSATSEIEQLEKTIANAKARLKELDIEEMENTEGGRTYIRNININSARDSRMCTYYYSPSSLKLKRYSVTLGPLSVFVNTNGKYIRFYDTLKGSRLYNNGFRCATVEFKKGFDKYIYNFSIKFRS